MGQQRTYHKGNALPSAPETLRLKAIPKTCLTTMAMLSKAPIRDRRPFSLA